MNWKLKLKTNNDIKIAYSLLHETKKVGEMFLCSNYLAPPKDDEPEEKPSEEPTQVIN